MMGLKVNGEKADFSSYDLNMGWPALIFLYIGGFVFVGIPLICATAYHCCNSEKSEVCRLTFLLVTFFQCSFLDKRSQKRYTGYVE